MLINLLADLKNKDEVCKGLSYEDAEAFIQWRKEKTGQNLRLPTEQEWELMKKEVGSQLTGCFWEWTSDIYRGISRVLRFLDFDYRDNYHPESRYYYNALRLVEDK